jgi:hypothetical protein
MKIHIRLVASAFVILLPAAFSSAQPGGTGMAFLRNGVGARAVAMGETGVAGSSFGEVLYYNPAMAAASGHSSLTIMHQQAVQDLHSQYLGAVAALDGWSLGLHIHLASIEDIEARALPGDPEGMFTSRNFSLGFTAAYRLTERIFLGANAKFLFEKIYVDDASGYAFDLGVRAQPFGEGPLGSLSFGAAVSNLGAMSELKTVSTKLPVLLRSGFAYDLPVGIDRLKASAALEGVYHPSDERFRAHIGAEASYDELLALRVGYQTGFDIKGFSAGVGFILSPARFDYAFVPYGEGFGTAHTFSVSLVF